MKQYINENIIIEGPVPISILSDAVEELSAEMQIGAHDIFLGQIRDDRLEKGVVEAIEYSAYQEMAVKQFNKIRTAAFEQFEVSAIYIYHSIGRVNVGELSLVVLVAAKHRVAVLKALPFVVEAIKADVPVFGKELFAEGDYVWKVNQ